jgi:hypothetical protein
MGAAAPMTVRPRIRPLRLLLVTFDLRNTTSGDPRYKAADGTMALYGQLFRPVKQNRLLITNVPARRIRAGVEQRIGIDTSIMILPVTALPEWRIRGVRQRAEWRRLVAALQAAGLEIAGIGASYESPP